MNDNKFHIRQKFLQPYRGCVNSKRNHYTKYINDVMLLGGVAYGIHSATPSSLIGTPTSAIPTILRQMPKPGTILPIYHGLGQAPYMLACMLGGLVWTYKQL